MSEDAWMGRAAAEEERKYLQWKADEGMSSMEKLAKKIARMERKGNCQHGWRRGKSSSNEAMFGGFICNRDGDEIQLPRWKDLESGDEVCLNCGAIIQKDDPRNWSVK